MNNSIVKVKGFFREVKEEIAKCTRPSWEELRESTVVVVITMAILGVFISASDFLISRILQKMMTL